jgi:hypothetical protein
MKIDSTGDATQTPRKVGLTGIDGGRADIERAALDAAFTDPRKLPNLLKRLSRPSVQHLTVIAQGEPHA